MFSEEQPGSDRVAGTTAVDESGIVPGTPSQQDTHQGQVQGSQLRKKQGENGPAH